MVSPFPPRRPLPEPPRVVAVLLELAGGQLVRFALAKPVPLRTGKERGRLVIDVVGERAWLTVHD